MNSKQQVLGWVAKIPPLKVVSFTEIGRQIDLHPRAVGTLLSGLSQTEMDQVPWYRVVNIQGEITSFKLGFKGELQRQLLLAEGYILIDTKVSPQHFYYFSTDESSELLF